MKWSDVRETVGEILDVAVECKEESIGICKTDRFATPAPSPIVNTTNGRTTVATDGSPALAWAARYVRQIQRWTKEANFEGADEVRFLVINVGGDAYSDDLGFWLFSRSHAFTSHFASLELLRPDEGDARPGIRLRLGHPFRQLSCVALVSGFYDMCRSKA